VLEAGLAAFAVVGFVAYAAPAAYGHTNPVLTGSSCQNGPGSGWSIKWTVQNDENVSESVTVTAATGGLSTLNTTTLSIAPTPPGQPESSTSIVQTLPNTASGTVTLSFTGTWSDGVTNSSSATYALSSNTSCGAPVQKQTLGGQIYLCSNGNPTTTSVAGGKLAATGPENISAVSDPMAPTSVPAGSYTMTASAPPGDALVACRGSSAPAANGLTATEAVTVPAGGSGEGVFYAASVPTVTPPHMPSPHPTPTIVNQGNGSLSLVKSSVFTNYNAVNERIPFDFDVTNTGGDSIDNITIDDQNAGVILTACPDPTLAAGASETCNGHYFVTQADLNAGTIVNTATATGTDSTTSETVTSNTSSVTLVSVQRIGGHIFQCIGANQTDFDTTGGFLAATGPTTVVKQPSPIAPPIPVATGVYTMTGTAPPGDAIVQCPGTAGGDFATFPYTVNPDGVTATETVPVGNGTTVKGVFFVEAAKAAITLKQSIAQPYFTGPGQTVTFDYLVANSGNIGLGSVGFTNTLAGITGLSCPQPILGVGLSETCTGKYTTSSADVGAQLIHNSATAHGTPPGLTAVSSSASAATVDLLAVSINKTASPTSTAAGSSTPITYTLTVKNSGKVTTPSQTQIADSAPVGTTLVSGSAACASGGSAACSVAVAAPTITWTIAPGVTPGQVYTLSFKATANASDPKGNIVNTALWNGAACPAGSCTTNTVTVPVTASSAAALHGGSGSGSGSSSSKLAFTGAMLAQQWMIGMGVILAGAALLIASHRRRHPRHAAARSGLLAALVTPQAHRRPSGERKD
jgi:uncharacterized repeat protein (TIGR01451 family)